MACGAACFENEPDVAHAGGPGLASIGHSTHPIRVFVRALRENGVGVVADVRSSPFSKYNPQFNRENLRRGLLAAGIQYDFLGVELGGRPDGDQFYDSDGHVLYGRMAKTASFRSGLDQLVERAERWRVAITCSEEDPARCHRFLLVTGALDLKGIPVTHIRCSTPEGDEEMRCTTQTSEDVKGFGIWIDGDHEQRDLFGEQVWSQWRSPKPVPRPHRAPSPCIVKESLDIYTIGFTKRSAEEFFEVLKNTRIDRLVDVRLHNTSQLAGFTKRDDLRYFLSELLSVEYVHEPLLAPTKGASQGLSKR